MQFHAVTAHQHERQHTDGGSKGGYDDRSQPQQTGFADGILRGQSPLPLGMDGKIHQQDGVLQRDPVSRNMALTAMSENGSPDRSSALTAPIPAKEILSRWKTLS